MSNSITVVLWSDSPDEKSALFKQIFEEAGLLEKCDFVYTAIGLKRKPTDKEIDSNRERVLQEIEANDPKVVLALGSIAQKSILPDKKETIKNLRERLHYYKTIPILISYHPNAMERKSFQSSQMYGKLKKDIEWAKSIAGGN